MITHNQKDDLEIDKIYKIIHSRKGTFTLRITEIGEEFVTGIILNGVAKNLSREDDIIGDKITIRKEFCIFLKTKNNF